MSHMTPEPGAAAGEAGRYSAEMYMRRVRRLDLRVDSLLAEKRRVRELLAVPPSDLSGMPRGSGGGDRICGLVVRLIELEDEIDRAIDELVDVRGEVLARLEALPADEYLVLHQYYLQGRTVSAIAERLHYCERQVYRLKRSGLMHLQDVIVCQGQGGV